MSRVADGAGEDAGAESPDVRLAALIARRLVADRLVVPADEASLREAIAAGRVSKAEWRAWAEGDDVVADGGGARG